jgi:hypothetical protein
MTIRKSWVVVMLLVAGCATTMKTRTPHNAGSAPDAVATAGPTTGPAGEVSQAGKPRAKRAASTTPGGRASAGVAAAASAISGGEVRIGISTTEGVDSVSKAYGIKGTSTAGTPEEAQAIVDHVNATGGLLGRKIIPVFRSFDVFSNSYSAQAQQACATWTQDRPVFAVVTATGDLDKQTLVSCLAQHRVPLFKSAAIVYDKAFADRYSGFFYQPEAMWGDRWAAVIDGLYGQGFFDAGAKIGLVRLDEPEHERTSRNVLRPRLAAHGLSLAEERPIPNNAGAQDVSRYSAEMANIVLSFKTANITHVLFLDASPGMPLLFMLQADNQQYRPRYGFGSLSAATLESNIPDSQLRRSMGVGWNPQGDVTLANAPPQNATKERCAKVLKDAGHKYTDGLAFGTALTYCSHLLLLQTALAKAGGFDVDALHAAIDGLSAWTPPTTFAAHFAPGRYDGVAAVRPYAFDDGCGCYRYTGSLTNVP